MNKLSLTTTWLSTDPRWTIAKRAEIIIFSSHEKKAFSGTVEAENFHCVWTNHPLSESKKSIEANDDWPDGWWWTMVQDGFAK